jgi:hypothetical protein
MHLLIYWVFWRVSRMCCVMRHFPLALSGSRYCHVRGDLTCLQHASHMCCEMKPFPFALSGSDYCHMRTVVVYLWYARTTRSYADVARVGLSFKPEARHNFVIATLLLYAVHPSTAPSIAPTRQTTTPMQGENTFLSALNLQIQQYIKCLCWSNKARCT